MLYPIIRNNKSGFINKDGEIIVTPQYGYVNSFSDNVCAVYNGTSEIYHTYENSTYYYGEVSAIDENGTLLFPFQKHIAPSVIFSEGLAFCQSQKVKKWGVIDKQGEIIIPYILDDCEYSKFTNGLAMIKKEGKYGFIDVTNNIIIPLIYDQASAFNESFAIVKIKSRSFLIDTEGNELKIKGGKIKSTFFEGLATIIQNKKYGFINTQGQIVIDCVYDSIIGYFTGGACVVCQGGKYGLIDNKGEILVDFVYDDARAFSCGVFPVKINKKWTLIDKAGEKLFEPKFEFIWPLDRSNGNIYNPHAELACAEHEKRIVYINKQGEILCVYDEDDKTIDYEKLKEILESPATKKDIWDKAKWSYDGFSITKKGAIKPFYFILKWAKRKGILTEEGIESYSDKNNLEICLSRDMFIDEACGFFDYFYEYWFEKQCIENYQIDPSLSFEADENLDIYWEYYTSYFNKTNI